MNTVTGRKTLPRLAITAGEPAGVGPELVAKLAMTGIAADLVAITDRDLLQRAATRCGLSLHVEDYDNTPRHLRACGSIRVLHVPLRSEEVPGKPDPRNAFAVLNTLAQAADRCLTGEFQAMVTAPVQKAVINRAGEHFTGHTEFLAQRAQADVVMMLASDKLRVTLATTHLPLSRVSEAITTESLTRTLHIIDHDLRTRFGLAEPRIAVLGLNPHAGENGYLGSEELDTIIPVIETLKSEGMHLLGPVPADTAFIPAQRERYDAVLSMYHDQALPVLKSEAFDGTVNITLGLPFIRTSVDHGTALDLAGTGKADVASLVSATTMALTLSGHRDAG